MEIPTTAARLPVLLLGLGLCALGLTACDADAGGDPTPENPDTGCLIPTRQLFESVPLDAIPALTDPPLVGPDDIDYLADDDLVFGFHLDGQAVAVPHNILNWHEVVNFNGVEAAVAVTFCPLTGSGLAFDRAAVGGAEFGVSGLIYLNNNVMYDRRSSPSLWSQMRSGAVCGEAAGTALRPLALVEMTWAGWLALYPSTRVISPFTGFVRNYAADPIQSYKEPHNRTLLFPMPGPLDTRRPPKERVLGVPDGQGGLAFPFLALGEGAARRALHAALRGDPFVVFFDRERNAALAYWLTGDDTGRTFDVRDGQIIDLETESHWQVDGRAVEGPLAGRRLKPIDEAYVSFWFAWAAFQPETQIWVDG